MKMSRVSPDTPQDRPLGDPQDAVQRDRPQGTPQQLADSTPTPATPGMRPGWVTVLLDWAFMAAVILVAVLLIIGFVALISSSCTRYVGPAIE